MLCEFLFIDINIPTDVTSVPTRVSLIALSLKFLAQLLCHKVGCRLTLTMDWWPSLRKASAIPLRTSVLHQFLILVLSLVLFTDMFWDWSTVHHRKPGEVSSRLKPRVWINPSIEIRPRLAIQCHLPQSKACKQAKYPNFVMPKGTATPGKSLPPLDSPHYQNHSVSRLHRRVTRPNVPKSIHIERDQWRTAHKRRPQRRTAMA